MRRIQLLIIIVLLASTAACGNSDKDEEKNYSVGILNPISVLDDTIVGFKEEMTERGYIEGENITYVGEESPNTMNNAALLEHAQMLVDAQVDVILAVTTPGALAAQQVTQEIPIIFTLVTDPISAGLLEDRVHPGGNITGLSDADPDPKRLEILTRIFPGLKRVYIPYDPNNVASTDILKTVTATADALDIEIISQATSDADAVFAAIENIPDDIDIVFLLPDVLLVSDDFVSTWGEFSFENKIPVTYSPHAGIGVSLMSYGVEPYPAGKQTANSVAQVLAGTAVGDLPVETLGFSLTLDLTVAEKLEIEVPTEVLRLASEIIRPE